MCSFNDYCLLFVYEVVIKKSWSTSVVVIGCRTPLWLLTGSWRSVKHYGVVLKSSA